jgi:hypothetical protein
VKWEGSTNSGTFPDGNTFTVDMWNNAINPVNENTGVARNNFRDFAVPKDDERVLYEIDGWQIRTIYWCI